jgi:8-oxo-dGTP diphosphatase
VSTPVTPRLTADVIIELADRPDRPIVLIERRNPPPGWAMPGGFVDLGESVESAALREAREETGLRVRLDVLLGVYSEPERDPRFHTASAVYVATARGSPEAADDARRVGVFDSDRMPAALAFDHGRILDDYRHWRLTGRVPEPGRADP